MRAPIGIDGASWRRRSKRTLEAILSATVALLERRSFDEISIAEIILKAGSSTGSFYARFATKEDLLPALYERYHQALPERMERMRRTLARRPHSLAETCRLIVEAYAAGFEEHPNLMRAIVLYARKGEGTTKPYLGERAKLHEDTIELFAPLYRIACNFKGGGSGSAAGTGSGGAGFVVARATVLE